MASTQIKSMINAGHDGACDPWEACEEAAQKYVKLAHKEGL